MGYDYALVHLTYNLPPAALLTLLYYPLSTRLDSYKILFLITIAVAATIPWDSYLIRTGIWTYPPSAVLGYTLLSIPFEEIFFFIIQTYNTTLLYLLLSKPVLPAIYLVKEGPKRDRWQYTKLTGQLVLALLTKKGLDYVLAHGPQTYLGLILVWATPFLFILWSLAYQLLLRLPLTSTLLPITLPTLYLWLVDTLALRRGTWVISSLTKTGLTLWPGLELEEAIFFLLTNTLIVWGLVAFDNAIAVLDAFPAHFPSVPASPSPLLLVQALLLPARAYDDDRILGLAESVARLRRKSRSFFLASSTFQGRLRIDLILLYSFCRVADDLVDRAEDVSEARKWVGKLREFLRLAYEGVEGGEQEKERQKAGGAPVKARDANRGAATLYAVQQFPEEAHLTLLLLPTERLAREPLEELVRGLEMDLLFPSPPSSSAAPGSAVSGKKTRHRQPQNGPGSRSNSTAYPSASGPITSVPALDLYGARVAGTVALLCIQLVLYHYPGTSEEKAKRLMAAGHDMGIALQYTNIARDLGVDALQGRCYVPPPWLEEECLSAEELVAGLVQAADDDSSSSSSPPLSAASSTTKAEAGTKTTYSNAVNGNNNDIKNNPDLDSFTLKVSRLRHRLLDRAFQFYTTSVPAIEELPAPARAPMRVAVESYMQIGRELRRPRAGWKVKKGRATVPLVRRIWVAWFALIGPRVGGD